MGRTKEHIDLPFVVGEYGSWEAFCKGQIQARTYYYPDGKVTRKPAK